MNPDNDVLVGAALARVLAREPAGLVTDPWDIPDGWRPGERAWTRFRLSHGPGAVTEVLVRGLASAGAEVAVGDGAPGPARAEFQPAARGGQALAGQPGAAGAGGGRAEGTDLVLSYAGRTVRFAYAAGAAAGPAGGLVTWLGRDGAAWAVADAPPAPLRGARAGAADGTVRSPMPGTVLAVHVSLGQAVSAGQQVLVVEAMKMEAHGDRAPRRHGHRTDREGRPASPDGRAAGGYRPGAESWWIVLYTWVCRTIHHLPRGEELRADARLQARRGARGPAQER